MVVNTGFKILNVSIGTDIIQVTHHHAKLAIVIITSQQLLYKVTSSTKHSTDVAICFGEGNVIFNAIKKSRIPLKELIPHICSHSYISNLVGFFASVDFRGSLAKIFEIIIFDVFLNLTTSP